MWVTAAAVAVQLQQQPLLMGEQLAAFSDHDVRTPQGRC